MKVRKTRIPDIMVIQPEVFQDGRGYFLESWNQAKFDRLVNNQYRFVQDNRSHSALGVLRGLHYQLEYPQGKLVSVLNGSVLDVAVDLRQSSPTFRQHIAITLSGENHSQLWIPPGFAHGFVVLSDTADFFYKTTDYYQPEDEQCIRWDDDTLKIDWQLHDLNPIVSNKDLLGRKFAEAKYYS